MERGRKIGGLLCLSALLVGLLGGCGSKKVPAKQPLRLVVTWR